MNIIQCLLARFGGAHYALLTCSFDSKVRRIKTMPNGTPYVRLLGSITGPTILEPDGKCSGANSYWRWEPLTYSSPSSDTDGKRDK